MLHTYTGLMRVNTSHIMSWWNALRAETNIARLIETVFLATFANLCEYVSEINNGYYKQSEKFKITSTCDRSMIFLGRDMTY